MTLLTGSLKTFKDLGAALSEVKQERVFLFCLTWALGGLLEMKDRVLFDGELRSFAANMPPREDEGDTIFEYLVGGWVGGWVGDNDKRAWRRRRGEAGKQRVCVWGKERWR